MGVIFNITTFYNFCHHSSLRGVHAPLFTIVRFGLLPKSRTIIILVLRS